MSIHLVIFGPPGAGKGTQAARIADRLGVQAISTGDIFRAAVKNETPLGLEVKRLIEAGEYVPDSLTNAIVRARLNEKDTMDGFLLDGYPRTPGQLQELDSILAFTDHGLHAVIELLVDREAVVERMLKRAEIEKRPDDTEPVIRRRLEVYSEESAPLTDVYRERGLLVEVDGMGQIDEVTDRIVESLNGRIPVRRP
jgi:adenylate kinase